MIIIRLKHLTSCISASKILSFLAHDKLRKVFIFATFINRTITSIVVIIVLSITLTSEHLIVFDKLLSELIFEHLLTNLTIP